MEKWLTGVRGGMENMERNNFNSIFPYVLDMGNILT